MPHDKITQVFLLNLLFFNYYSNFDRLSLRDKPLDNSFHFCDIIYCDIARHDIFVIFARRFNQAKTKVQLRLKMSKFVPE